MALRPDAWLGGLLGKSAWHLSATSAEITEMQMPDDGPCFVDAKLPVADIEGVARLQGRGFQLVDTGVVLDRPVGAPIHTKTARFANADDRLSVERIAEQSFTFSRFHQDPMISKSVADRIKRAWAGNFFAGERGDHMVVAEQDGVVAGFLQLLEQETVLTIDLVAVSSSYRGKGLATDMIHFAEAQLPQIAHLRVGTQAANVRSLRSYQANGFRHFSANHVMHFHG